MRRQPNNLKSVRSGKSTKNGLLPCDELRARCHDFDGQLLLPKVLVDSQYLQKISQNLVVDLSLSLSATSYFRIFFPRVPPVVSETNTGTGMRRDGEKKVVYKVCGDVFLGISPIPDVTLVEFVELRGRYAKLSNERLECLQTWERTVSLKRLILSVFLSFVSDHRPPQSFSRTRRTTG